MNKEAKLEAAQRLINIVCGEPYGDGMVVTDIGIGYAEPGYHDDETVWVLGNWNEKTWYDRLHRPHVDKTPGRLFDALECIGVEGEWLDEWYRCSHCYRIVRCHADSYMWKPSYVQLEDGDVLCHECAVDPEFIEDVMEPYINNPEKVLTWLDRRKLDELGFQRVNAHQYENGFHPGQNDNPKDVYDRIVKENPNLDIVFWLDEASQFYIGFSAYARPKKADDEDTETQDSASDSDIVSTGCCGGHHE